MGRRLSSTLHPLIVSLLLRVGRLAALHLRLSLAGLAVALGGVRGGRRAATRWGLRGRRRAGAAGRELRRDRWSGLARRAGLASLEQREQLALAAQMTILVLLAAAARAPIVAPQLRRALAHRPSGF